MIIFFYTHSLTCIQEKQLEGDPELVEDAEFYQQLLKEFFETIDPASSGIVITRTVVYWFDESLVV